MISPLREWLYRGGILRSHELPASVISVGNLSMGGTGKSPFALHLCQWALGRGISTALLTRGYKRKHRNLEIVLPAAALPDADHLGDEPWMIKHRLPGIALLVHADRARMAKRHWADLGKPKLVVLDDAFQHWRAWRDWDVVMLDATEALQGAFPFGKFRESASALKRADLVVITRARTLTDVALRELKEKVIQASQGNAKRPWRKDRARETRVIAVDYEFDHFFDFATGQVCERPQDKNFVLASGVAKPDGVRSLVAGLKLPVKEEIYFPDHHHLDQGEIATLNASLKSHGDAALLTTEKDWARWRKELKSFRAFGFRIKLSFLSDGERVLAEFLAEVEKCSTSR